MKLLSETCLLVLHGNDSYSKTTSPSNFQTHEGPETRNILSRDIREILNATKLLPSSSVERIIQNTYDFFFCSPNKVTSMAATFVESDRNFHKDCYNSNNNNNKTDDKKRTSYNNSQNKSSSLCCFGKKKSFTEDDLNDYDKLHEQAVRAFGDKNRRSGDEYQSTPHIVVRERNKLAKHQNSRMPSDESLDECYAISRSKKKNKSTRAFYDSDASDMLRPNKCSSHNKRDQEDETFPDCITDDSSETESDYNSEFSDPKLQRRYKAIYESQMKKPILKADDDNRRDYSTKKKQKHVEWESPEKRSNNMNQNGQEGNDVLATCKLYEYPSSAYGGGNCPKNSEVNFFLVKKDDSKNGSCENRSNDEENRKNMDKAREYFKQIHGQKAFNSAGAVNTQEQYLKSIKDSGYPPPQGWHPQLMPPMMSAAPMPFCNPMFAGGCQIPNCNYPNVANKTTNPVGPFVIAGPPGGVPQCNGAAMIYYPLPPQSCGVQPPVQQGGQQPIQSLAPKCIQQVQYPPLSTSRKNQ